MISPPPKKNTFKKLLLEVIGASAILHVILLFLFGGFTVWRYVANTGAQFDEPPAMVEEQPPPPDVEVAVQRPRASAEMPQREIRTQPVGNIAVAEVPTDIPMATESFSVAGAGGGELGRMRAGNVGGRVGLGISEINVFGLRDEGERIIIAVDGGTHMMTDARGGLHTYNAIKEEVVRLVDGLSAGTLFNVIIFDSRHNNPRIDRFQANLTAATPENTERLKNWIEPLNSDPNRLGVRRNTLSPQNTRDHEIGKVIVNNSPQVNARLRLTQVLLEQQPDLVYIITSGWRGFDRARRPLTEREQEADQRRRESDEYQRRLERYRQQRDEVAERVRRAEAADNERRRARGLPERVWSSGSLQERARAYGFNISNPPVPARAYFPEREVVRYFREILHREFREEGRAIPRFNIIELIAEDGELSRSHQETLRDYLRHFRSGRFRELRGLRAIQSFQEREETT